MPAGALAGLCPACLLAQGADTEPGDSGGSPGFQPPPLEEIIRLFPDLEILSLLGAGGMGAVYKARQPSLDRFVALKVLPGKGSGSKNFEERFNREARALARLNHPNIVAVFEFGQVGGEDGLHFFIMEFVDGANLRQLEQAGRLAPREALQIIPQICDALQYAHDEGIVHRDIKPENVLVDRKGRVKIADFGLAKMLGVKANTSRLTAEGQVMGTPHYMAPEQIEKPLSVDHRADIYSLGVVLYEMLTGDLPLGKFPPPSRKYQLDVRLDEVVLRALENDPARRYQQASEVKSQVENIAGSALVPPLQNPPANSPGGEAGFPLTIERAGRRVVHWKGVLVWFGIIFGFLTIGFGAVSIVTGRSLMGWLGVVGWLSRVVRLVLSIVVVLGMVRWSLRRREPASLPRTLEGTLILPAKGFSRKAILGLVCLPVAALVPLATTISPAITDTTLPGSDRWPGILATGCLLLGLAAAFASSILGTLAVWDIRRSQGRISGLRAAVLAQLFLPLLLLDAAICSASVNGFALFRRPLIEEIVRLFQAPTMDLTGALAICVAVDIFIIRRLWRAARSIPRPVEAEVKLVWNSESIGAVLVVICWVILCWVAQRRSSPEAFDGVLRSGETNLAAIHSGTNALEEQLAPDGGPFLVPVNGGTVELVAVRAYPYEGGTWWCPDGSPSSIPANVEANVLPESGPAARGIEYLLRVRCPGMSFLDPTLYGAKGDARYSVSRRLPPPIDAKETTYTLWLADGPWRTAAVQKTGFFGALGSDRGRSHWNWQSNPDGSILLEVEKWPLPAPNTAQQFVAVDARGVEHLHWKAQRDWPTRESFMKITMMFGGAAAAADLDRGLTLDQVDEFRFQIRHGRTVVFKHVSVQPGHRTQVAVVRSAP